MINRGEVSRKLIHLTNVIIPVGYLFLFPSKIHMLIILFFLSVIFIFLDFSRTRIGWIKTIFGKMFNFMLRTHELDGRLTGATWVVIGSFLTVALFQKEIAILALLFMGLGDTVAALFGAHFGRIRIWEKTVEGTLAGLVVCLMVSVCFPGMSVWVRTGGAISAMIAELIPLPVDDNIRIPIISGTIMMFLSSLSV